MDLDEHRHVPDRDRLSVVTAMVLLTYALTPFIKLPASVLRLEIAGAVFALQFDFTTILSLAAALLAATGAAWLLQSHPHASRKASFIHWILPALTAWMIGVPLSSLEVSGQWWVVLGLGAVLFLLVLVAEYIASDTADIRYGPAIMALTAVSFAIFLILAIAVKAAGLRLYLLLPALVIPLGLIVLRTLYLRLEGRWQISWAIGIALAVGQMALGLHYLPLTSTRFGLILLGPAYALTSLAGGLSEEQPRPTAWVEPVIMLVIFWLLAWLVGG